MTRTLTTVGMVALLGLGLIGQPALGQPVGPGADARSEIFETQVLIAFNEAGLSVEQLETIQGLAQATLDAREDFQAEHEAFQEFLTNWDGSPDEFEAALEEARQGVAEAREALMAQMQANVDTLQNSLTAAQYEALEQVGPGHRMGPGPRGEGPRFGRDGRHGERGPDGPNGPNGPDGQVERLGLFLHPDLLVEIVTAKIEALQAE